MHRPAVLSAYRFSGLPFFFFFFLLFYILQLASVHKHATMNCGLGSFKGMGSRETAQSSTMGYGPLTGP